MSQSETQSQRWLKYGVNVALSSVIVVLLACGVVYLAQRNPKRIDTTVAGIYSLKPQTRSVLGATTQKVRLISLYPNPTLEGKTGDARDRAEEDRSRAGTVEDLLQEYTKVSRNISIDFIDPERESTKLDTLIEEVTATYGEELKPYKAFLAEFPQFVETFKAFSDTQAKAVSERDFGEIKDRDIAQTLILMKATITGLAPRLKQSQEDVAKYTDRKIPNYRGAVDQISGDLRDLDLLLGTVIDQFKSLPEAAPAAVRGYAQSALPEWEKMRAEVSAQTEKTRSLGEIKLDALRRSIGRSTILMMGEKEMKVLSFGDVWQVPDDLRSLMATARTEKPRLKFAGEQQISSALVSLSRPKKPRVIFVRPARAPLVQNMFGRAPFSGLGRRLREADFELLEKDLSGQFAMQAQMQGVPVSEATEEQMKDRDAVWVVFALTGAMTQAGPNPIPGKLMEHLAEGGSAVVLFEPDADDLANLLKDYGASVRTSAVVVKDVSDPPASLASLDIIEQAQFIPHIFVTSSYGQHPLAKPVGALQSLLLGVAPVELHPTAGVIASGLLPIPQDVRTWGETDTASVFTQGGAKPTFDASKDIPNTASAPLFGGAAIEKGKSRLVLLGSASSFSNNILNIADSELERQGILTPRFPGNSELFTNAVYWAAKNEVMLEISPAAMEVSRIRAMSAGQLTFVRALLVGGLPGLVVIAGVVMYLKRN